MSRGIAAISDPLKYTELIENLEAVWCKYYARFEDIGARWTALEYFDWDIVGRERESKCATLFDC